MVQNITMKCDKTTLKNGNLMGIIGLFRATIFLHTEKGMKKNQINAKKSWSNRECVFLTKRFLDA